MMVSARMSARYPMLTDWIYANIGKVPRKKRVFDAFVLYAELTPDDARDALVTTSRHPVVDYREMPGSNGQFSGGTDEERVFLAKNICDKFEGSAADRRDPRMHMLVESTILHELVHWGDWKDGVDQPHEEGKAFERAAYGRDITTYW